MNDSFKQGFLKKAAEYGIPEDAAMHLLKQADLGGWLHDKWTNTKDNFNLLGAQVGDSKLKHGLMGFGSWIKGNGFDSGYNQSQQLGSANLANAFSRQFQNRIAQGDGTTGFKARNNAIDSMMRVDDPNLKRQLVWSLQGPQQQWQHQYDDAMQQQHIRQQGNKQLEQFRNMEPLKPWKPSGNLDPKVVQQPQVKLGPNALQPGAKWHPLD